MVDERRGQHTVVNEHRHVYGSIGYLSHMFVQVLENEPLVLGIELRWNQIKDIVNIQFVFRIISGNIFLVICRLSIFRYNFVRFSNTFFGHFVRFSNTFLGHFVRFSNETRCKGTKNF